MEPNERTRDVFEDVGAYPKPPLVPLPDLDNFDYLDEMGFKSTVVSNRILKTALLLAGFRSFQKQLPERLEDLLRKSDMRGGGLYSPVISASLALTDDPRNLDPIERAATMIFAVYHLYDEIFSGRFEPDRVRDQVLEMGQYPNFFSTSQILENRRARIYKSNKITQITVIVARRLYTLEIGKLDNDVTYHRLKQSLGNIITQAEQNRVKQGEPLPGLLTCAANMTQSRIFSKIEKIEQNRISLQALRHSFFTLCFDLESKPTSYAEAAFMAHGTNNANRWYHSSLQLVVFGNAKACAICNFSTYLDGNTMMRGVAEIQKRALTVAVPNSVSDSKIDLLPSISLEWKIAPNFMQAATKDLRSVMDNQQATYEILDYGKKYFDTHGLDPVPTFILALQMTSNRLTGKKVKIMQFLSMSKYRCGDLVTAIVTTPEVLQFVDCIEDNAQSKQALTLLRAAIKSQVDVCRKARKHLPFSDVFTLFLASRNGLRRWYVILIILATRMLLRLLNLIKLEAREVIVSHPNIYPEIPVVGRPGIRLPYVKYFGLHYQILDEKIVITLMPSLRWKIPNGELIAELEQNLKRIHSLIDLADGKKLS